MCMTDHIFLVLLIKDLKKNDGNPTMIFKIAIGTKPSVSYLRMLFFHVLYGKLLHTWDKGVKYASPSTESFSRYISWNYTASKGISCVRTQFKEDNIFI